jgi:hypothetical protein
MPAKMINPETEEFNNLLTTLEGKSQHTLRNYSIQYRKLKSLLEVDNIMDADDEKILEVCNKQNTENNKLNLLNIAICIFKNEKRDETNLIIYRDELRESLKQQIKDKNKKINLPSYKEICDLMEFYYNNGDYKDYLINWLLINFNVRNQDLLIKIVSKKEELDPEANINYIHFNNGVCTYVRFNYKTKNKHGTKKNVIREPKIKEALKFLKKQQDDGIYIIPSKDQVAYHVQKSTLNNIGEGAYNKIIINHFRNDLQQLKLISQNRGTSIDTLAEFYDIKNV